MSAAHADGCLTSSHGLYFYSWNQDVNQSTNQVLQQCQQNSVTANAECSSNLQCGFQVQNPYPSNEMVCYSRSHNIGFQVTGAIDTIDTLTQNVVSQCQQSSVTVNTECSQNLGCADRYSAVYPYPSGNVLCTTFSHNIPFRARGSASEVGTLANQVAQQCQQNSETVNTECSSNLQCRDAGFQGPPPVPPTPGPWPRPPGTVTCRTESHSIPFTASGPSSQVDQLTSQVLTECQQNPVTVNTECSSNLSCR